MSDLLPVFQGLTNIIVDVAIKAVHRQGKDVSCRAGCGACCRQPVPISSSEALALRVWIQQQAEDEQAKIRQRFQNAIIRLEAASVLEAFRSRQQQELRVAALEYFRVGVACPFLENESCSIHSIRPLACREYLVTSPATECAHPSPETIEMVPLPGQPSRRLMEMDGKWTLLVLALEEDGELASEAKTRTGPEIAQEFIERLL